MTPDSWARLFGRVLGRANNVTGRNHYRNKDFSRVERFLNPASKCLFRNQPLENREAVAYASADYDTEFKKHNKQSAK